MNNQLYCDPQGLIQPILPTMMHSWRARNMDTGALMDIQAPEYQNARDCAETMWPGARIACWMAED